MEKTSYPKARKAYFVSKIFRSFYFWINLAFHACYYFILFHKRLYECMISVHIYFLSSVLYCVSLYSKSMHHSVYSNKINFWTISFIVINLSNAIFLHEYTPNYFVVFSFVFFCVWFYLETWSYFTFFRWWNYIKNSIQKNL